MQVIEDEPVVMTGRPHKLMRNAVAAAMVAAIVAAWGVPLVADAQEQPAPMPPDDVRVVNQPNEPVPVTAASRPFQKRYAALSQPADWCHAVEPPEGMYIVFNWVYAWAGENQQVRVYLRGNGQAQAWWQTGSRIDREFLLYALPGPAPHEVSEICVESSSGMTPHASWATITGRYEPLPPE